MSRLFQSACSSQKHAADKLIKLHPKPHCDSSVWLPLCSQSTILLCVDSCAVLWQICVQTLHTCCWHGACVRWKKAADYSHINTHFPFLGISRSSCMLPTVCNELFLERSVRDQMLHCQSSRFTIKIQTKATKNAEIRTWNQYNHEKKRWQISFACLLDENLCCYLIHWRLI